MECARCNGTDEGHLIGYRRGLVKRYGVEMVEDIERRYLDHQRHPGAQKEHTQEQYHNLIIELIALMNTQDMLKL